LKLEIEGEVGDSYSRDSGAQRSLAGMVAFLDHGLGGFDGMFTMVIRKAVSFLFAWRDFDVVTELVTELIW
jgi:hypothetical protein